MIPDFMLCRFIDDELLSSFNSRRLSRPREY
nr:hypothetical protein CWKEJDCK_CWKEJDCK_CDS_0006 [Microvirus sp.]